MAPLPLNLDGGDVDGGPASPGGPIAAVTARSTARQSARVRAATDRESSSPVVVAAAAKGAKDSARRSGRGNGAVLSGRGGGQDGPVDGSGSGAEYRRRPQVGRVLVRDQCCQTDGDGDVVLTVGGGRNKSAWAGAGEGASADTGLLHRLREEAGRDSTPSRIPSLRVSVAVVVVVFFCRCCGGYCFGDCGCCGLMGVAGVAVDAGSYFAYFVCVVWMLPGGVLLACHWRRLVIFHGDVKLVRLLACVCIAFLPSRTA